MIEEAEKEAKRAAKEAAKQAKDAEFTEAEGEDEALVTMENAIFSGETNYTE